MIRNLILRGVCCQSPVWLDRGDTARFSDSLSVLSHFWDIWPNIYGPYRNKHIKKKKKRGTKVNAIYIDYSEMS